MNDLPTKEDVLSPYTPEGGKKENERQNAAFRDYCYLGVGRSLYKLEERYQSRTPEQPKPPTLSVQTLKQWSTGFDWQKRVAIFDDILFEEEEKEWTERRRAIREQDFALAQQLRDLARGVLEESPSFFTERTATVDPGTPAIVRIVVDQDGKEISRETVDPGTPKKTVQTIAIRTKDAIDAATAASRLQRLAAEMDTDRHTINVHHETVAVEIRLPDGLEDLGEK